MTNDNLQALKDVVIKNTTLRELHWDENNVTSKHVIAITHALKQNRSLQLCEFPTKDFEKELAREKNQQKALELQMVKKKLLSSCF